MRRTLLIAALLPAILSLGLPSPVFAAKVLIVGDTQYAMVAEIVSAIQVSLRTPGKEYATSDIRGKLGAIVEREEAQVVVALGADATGEALNLPPSVAVVYGLVVAPPISNRENITGVYMSPPVNEYVSTIQRYLPTIGKIAVVGSPNMMKVLLGTDDDSVAAYRVTSSSDLLNTIQRLVGAKALLLLPDANLLISPVMSNAYLFSFRNNIPLLGISEANVRQGSLFALVFDPRTVSRQIGEKVQAILNGVDAGDIFASPPRKYNLFINSNTAEKMGIVIPDELARKAKKNLPINLGPIHDARNQDS